MKPPRRIPIVARCLVACCLIVLLASLLRAADNPSIDSANPASVPSTNLLTRTFKVDRDTFREGLENIEGIALSGEPTREVSAAGPPINKRLNVAVRNFFTTVGVDFSAPKSIFYNEAQGILFVRATAQDLAIVEQAVQVLNIKPPQVNLRVQFFELSPKSPDGFFPSAGACNISKPTSYPTI